jgi:peptide deformylase
VKKTVMGEDGRRRIQLVDEELTTPNVFEPAEGCMSFPRRTPRGTQRIWRIKVRYSYPTTTLGITRLKTAEEWCEGLKAQIFQHEIEHFEGKNIYFSS